MLMMIIITNRCTNIRLIVMNSIVPIIHFRTIKVSEFLTELSNPRTDRVLYLQQQNNSFNTEFSELMEDIDPAPSWASDVFG